MNEDRSVLGRPARPPDATLRYGPDEDHVADAWFGVGSAAAPGSPLVMLVHGGFWRPEYDRVHLRPMAAALRDDGWDVVSIEYRRAPAAPDLTVADVGAAVATLPSVVAETSAGSASPTTSEREVIVVGHSAGGHLALWAAATAPPPFLVGAVALAPVADLRLAHELDLDGGAVADFLGAPPEQRADLDTARLGSAVVPVVILHGTADRRVPLGVSESYVAAHPSTRLVRVPGADHFALIDPRSAAWPLVTSELHQFPRGGRR